MCADKLVIKNFVSKKICYTFALQMGKDNFKIDLLGRNIDGLKVEYTIDDSFFQKIDGLIWRGQVHTTVEVAGNTQSRYRFTIRSRGIVYAPCDRCLADVAVPVDTVDELSVMLGDDYSDEGDLVVVPENDGVIDISQFIYEYIALSMPLKLVHAPGECDEAMIDVLKAHLSARSSEDTDEEE